MTFLINQILLLLKWVSVFVKTTKLDSCRTVSEDWMEPFAAYEQECWSCVLITSASWRSLSASSQSKNHPTGVDYHYIHSLSGQIHPLCNPIKLYKILILTIPSKWTALMRFWRDGHYHILISSKVPWSVTQEGNINIILWMVLWIILFFLFHLKYIIQWKEKQDAAFVEIPKRSPYTGCCSREIILHSIDLCVFPWLVLTLLRRSVFFSHYQLRLRILVSVSNYF